MKFPLSFRKLRRVNVVRCQRWHPGFPNSIDKWSGADWSNAMCGEAGEAANVVKKLRRKEHNLVGALDPDYTILKEKLGEEIADVIIYGDLLARFYGIDLDIAIRSKFNQISIREGFPERL